MLSVEAALARICADVTPRASQRVAIGDALGRVLATDIVAATTQPPFDASAMDGYAVRFADARDGATLRVIGEAAAGAPFPGRLGEGDAVRIFTGGVVPAGADHIVIQEDTRAEGREVLIAAPQAGPAHVRKAGIDFVEGEIIAPAGRRLAPIDLALIAAANVPEINVAGRPVVALFDNGDELVEPGAALRPGEIVGSNRFALEALLASWGATPRYLGRAADSPCAIIEKFDESAGADLVIAIGGASVGDHDHMKNAFGGIGGQIHFSKIAVKPGKPTWFGELDGRRVIGLPGNPASAIVCAILFVRPLIAAMLGAQAPTLVKAPLAAPLPANGARETYLRARRSEEGVVIFDNQDSSLLSPLAGADVLVRRSVEAPAAARGEFVDCVVINASLGVRRPLSG